MVTIEFDDALDDHATTAKDRTQYPPGADVHITISDNFLNVDPTDEDSWTFGSNFTNATTVYQAFDENGQFAVPVGTIGKVTPNLQAGGNLTTIDAGDLGVILVNYNPNGATVPSTANSILALVDNNDQIITPGATRAADTIATSVAGGTALDNLGVNNAPITFVETEATSGIFQNTDESDVANVRVATDAPRGTTATFDYNDEASSIVVSNFFGTLNMDESALGGEWNSGEELPVLLTDQDTNLNSKVDEDISIPNPRFTIIPSLRIGSPITLAGGNATFNDSLTGVPGFGIIVGVNATTIDQFSDVLRARSSIQQPFTAGTTGFLNFTLASTVAQVNAFSSSTATNAKYTYFNYDIRSFESGFKSNPFSIRVSDVTGAVSVLITPVAINDY